MSERSERAVRRVGAHRLWANPAYRAVLERLGFADPTRFRAALASAQRIPGGRSEHTLIELSESFAPFDHPGLPADRERIRLRPVRRGGLFGGCLGDRHFSPRRIARELDLWLELDGLHFPLPTPVAAIASRHVLFWRCHFAALDRAGARDGAAFLAEEPSARVRIAAAASAGRALRRLHDAGVLHGDLQLRNLLVEIEGAATGSGANADACGHGAGDARETAAETDRVRVLFIDFERARRPRRVSPRARRAECLRLARSIAKLELSDRVDRRSRSAFLAAYCERDRALRRRLVAGARSARLGLALHRLGWGTQKGRTRNAVGLTSLPAALVLAGLLAMPLACGPAGEPPPTAMPRLSLLALGDTGRAGSKNALFEGQLAVASALAREARRDPVEGLLLLGDNFYDRGLDRTDWVARVRANLVEPYCPFLDLSGPESDRVAETCPIPPAERRPVPIYAVLGNHDLRTPESAELQRYAVPRLLPGWQMSEGLTRVFELGSGISLVLFESEIAIEDRAAIRSALVAAVRKARGPWRILATHRPIATDDFGGVPEGGYPDWVREALDEADVPLQLVLAGHHHSLQAFALKTPTALLQIGAGSGSRAEPPLATGHPALLFSEQTLGFARVDLVGEGKAERLVVSLFSAPRWPWLERLLGPSLRARFAVDRSGQVEEADSGTSSDAGESAGAGAPDRESSSERSTAE